MDAGGGDGRERQRRRAGAGPAARRPLSREHHAPWVPDAADRALAHRLGEHAAWLPLGDGRVAFARHERLPRTPRSAVLDLVQGIERRFPSTAHALLRRRIRATSLAPFDRDVVRVTAKRVSVVDPLPGPTRAELLDLGPDAAAARAEVALVDPGGRDDPAARVRRLQAGVTGGRPGVDRPIAAVLVGDDGALVGAALNRAGANRTFHAEVALLQALADPPRAGTLTVGLQCCRMCAALLLDVVPGVRVRYLEPDPGPFARDTALRRAGAEEPE